MEVDVDNREGGDTDASLANGASNDGNDDDRENNNDNSRNKDESRADPLRWEFNRMSHMVVHKGEARRRAVFSWFLAMVAVHEPAVALSHIRLMLLPLRRAVLDAESGGVEPKERSSTGGGGSAADPEKEQTSAELAIEVGWSVFGLVWLSSRMLPLWPEKI